MFNNITLVIISYKSENSITQCLKNIDKKFKIIIVENSGDEKIKKKFENWNDNIKVILNENTGYGAGINLAAKEIKTKYFFVISPDIKVYQDTIKNLYFNANKLDKKFIIIVPKYLNLSIKSIQQMKDDKTVSAVKEIAGAAIFFNKNNFDKINGFDEKIFMYYEENDIFKRSIKNKYSIYQINNSFVKHFGASSIDTRYRIENEINRNWHYMWSYFYYNKKHFGKLYATLIAFPLFVRSLFRLILFYFASNDKYYIYKARFSGLLNSFLNKKSWYRLKIK